MLMKAPFLKDSNYSPLEVVPSGAMAIIG